MDEERKVIVIEPTKRKAGGELAEARKKRRVAAYARVSTDEEEQLTSYQNQMEYYTRYIQAIPDWEFVGMYSDEGISGLNTKKREGFRQMVEDAMNGKIDLILTKSISRFARNTVDSLVTIRQLKANGVEIYFEKENIYTFDSKGELMITIMSSIAQEESRSISENVTWSLRKNMEKGKVTMAYSQFLGYRKGPDGKPEIVPEEAEVVRRIYSLYLKGCTVREICRILKEDGIPTPRGKNCNWSVSTAVSILRNEKYKGDALLQKVYTSDFLNKKSKKNNGELRQFYVKDSHPAIIDEATFDLVQEEMARRGKEAGRGGTSPLSRKVFCGECGHLYGPKLWHADSSRRIYVWRCTHKYAKEPNCSTPNVREEDLKTAFVIALNRILESKEEYIDLLMREMETVKPARMALIRDYLDGLKKQPKIVTSFRGNAFNAVAEKITVMPDGSMVVRFKDGREVSVEKPKNNQERR